jgi:hypothetical protein
MLFYTDGSTVWDRNNTIMPNGTGLVSSSTCTMSAVIIPKPGSSTLYYIFTPPDYISTALYFSYSVVDMSLNNGNGDVTVKNTALFNPSTEKVTATRHSNGTDYWVVGHKYNSSDFYAYLVTAAGVTMTPVISTVGTLQGGVADNSIGYMRLSPCGNKLATAVLADGILELFDFNNTTGVVSNALTLGTYTPGNPWGLYGLEFSPDNSKLYAEVENPPLVVQYDVNAGSASAIIASATTVFSLPTTLLGAMQNGPDGKIYFSRISSEVLAVINYPNLPGTSCGFTDSAVTIAGYNYHGLPNFYTSIFCSPGTSVAATSHSNMITSFYIDRGTHMLHVSLAAGITGRTSIEILNALGAIVYRETIAAGALQNKVTIPLADFSCGVYVLKITGSSGAEVKKILVD